MTVKRRGGTADIERDVGGAVFAMGVEATQKVITAGLRVVDAELETQAERGGIASGSANVAPQPLEAGRELLG